MCVFIKPISRITVLETVNQALRYYVLGELGFLLLSQVNAKQQEQNLILDFLHCLRGVIDM